MVAFLPRSSACLACRAVDRVQSGYRNRACATATGARSATRRDWRGSSEGRVVGGRLSDPVHSAANTTGYNHIDEAGGFDATWELDVFGKLRREIEASHFDALAAAKARDAVLVSVIANVARAYIELRGFQEQIAVTRRNIG